MLICYNNVVSLGHNNTSSMPRQARKTNGTGVYHDRSKSPLIYLICKICLIITVILFYGCKRNETGMLNPIVANSIDSICALSEPIRDSHFEHIWLDERYLTDERNPRFKQWIYGDSIAKYCNTDELTELATKHNSLAVRYVAFKMLLNRDSHKAIKVLIDDIDSNDSIIATHLDEGSPRLLSGLRVGLVQGDRNIYNISIADSIAVVKAVLTSKNKSKFYFYSSIELRKELDNHGTVSSVTDDKDKK